MENLRKLLEEGLDEGLLRIVLSGRRSKEALQKVKIRPLKHKGNLIFQAALWDGKKELHRNYEKEELISAILMWMSSDFSQLQMSTTSMDVTALVSRKGKVTIRTRKSGEDRKPVSLGHNRAKRYLLQEGAPVPFLVKLGVMTPDGKVVSAYYDKFRQINRFLEFIEDICPVLEQTSGRELQIIDFGCGKSYLTFAMYEYLHNRRGLDVRITGLDLKADVINRCSRLAEELGCEKLHFQPGDIADYKGEGQADLVVTLHACDTATDYALAYAVKRCARVILSVPCCQHELNAQIQSDVLQPVLKYGLLKERMAALLTDGLRASLLEEAGYQVQVLEFIDMEHTPKNVLIRAVRRNQDRSDGLRSGKEEVCSSAAEEAAGRSGGETKNGADAKAASANAYDGKKAEKAPYVLSPALSSCMDFLHVRPTLARLLRQGDEDGILKICSPGNSKAGALGNGAPGIAEPGQRTVVHGIEITEEEALKEETEDIEKTEEAKETKESEKAGRTKETKGSEKTKETKEPKGTEKPEGPEETEETTQIPERQVTQNT